jgi:hypothetical protein
VHPGEINTNIVRNARFRKDPAGRGRTQEQMAQEFAAITMTEPDKAAEIIHRGVEAGKARILWARTHTSSTSSRGLHRPITTTC